MVAQSIGNVISFNQADYNTGQIILTLNHNKEAIDVTTATNVTAYFLRPDGTVSSQDFSNGIYVDESDSKNNVVVLDINTDSTLVSGVASVEIHVEFSGQTIVFKRFQMTIDAAIFGGNASNNYQVLYPIQFATSLPVASSQNKGKIYYISGASGTSADSVYMCKMLSDGTYDWIQFV